MRIADEDEKHVDIEFERFRGEDVLITAEAVESINAYCKETGEQYVDPQFPPVSRSLYINESDGSTWECFHCHARTALPPVPSLPTSEQEAAELEAQFALVVCQGCGEKAPFVVKTRYFNRPLYMMRSRVTGWHRARARGTVHARTKCTNPCACTWAHTERERTSDCKKLCIPRDAKKE